MNATLLFFKVAGNRMTLISGIKLAAVVGIILNVINQGDVILRGAFGDVHWPKFFLTFCVPFCVSVYSATLARIRFDPGTRAYVDAHLKCESCGDKIQDVGIGEMVPECSDCGQETNWQLSTTN